MKYAGSAVAEHYSFQLVNREKSCCLSTRPDKIITIVKPKTPVEMCIGVEYILFIGRYLFECLIYS